MFLKLGPMAHLHMIKSGLIDFLTLTCENFKMYLSSKNTWPALSKLIWDTDLTSFRFILALAELIWALELFWPGNTLDLKYSTYNFVGIIPEVIWALIFLISGTFQFFIVMYEKIDTKFSKFFAFVNALIWTYFVLSIIIQTYPPIIAMASSITLVIAANWIWIRPYILAEGLYRAGIRKKE